MRLGQDCRPRRHDPPRALSPFERAILMRVLAEDRGTDDLNRLLDATTIAEDCDGCATFYCHAEDDWVEHWNIGPELAGRDEDGMGIDCIVFMDASGIWGADIYRHDGQPWLASPDATTFVET